jgi:hypothetical protein
MKKTLILLPGLLLLLSAVAYGQMGRSTYKHWRVGLSVGTMTYQGDLDDNGLQPWIGLVDSDEQWGNPLRVMGPSVGANVGYQFHPHMSLVVGMKWGKISASDSTSSDPNREFRDLDFQNNIIEGSAILQYEFFANERHYKYRPKWSPYVFAGVGVFYHNPFTFIRQDEIDRFNSQLPGTDLNQFAGEKIFLQELRTEGQGATKSAIPQRLRDQYEDDPYSLVQFSIPIGIGIRRKLTERMDLKFHVGVRKTFTDHLDDVGNVYYSNPEWYLEGSAPSENASLSYVLSDRSGYRELGTTGYNTQEQTDGIITSDQDGEKRGFENQDDWYAFTGFTLTYIINKEGIPCPKFAR